MRFSSKSLLSKIIKIIMIFIITTSNVIVLLPNNVKAATYNQITYEANANNHNGIDNFPLSYQILLNKLVEDTGHKNWKFKAFQTDIDWSELISTQNENACYRNTIYKGNDSRWYCSAEHTKAEYGGDGYYCASSKIVNYYLDPRNFLTETTIFQFLDLSNSSPASVEDIQKALNGSFMQGNTSTGESYAKIIFDAAAESGENALSIVTKIYQEIGKGKPGNPPLMAAGTDTTYPKTYNFFNYGATDGTGAITRGLIYAKNSGWDSERKAIIEGAKLISNSYIKMGQNTKYTFKFDVVGSEKNQLYSHQYMTNIQDPTNQSQILFSNYTNNGWLENELTFIIPVYKNMPAYVKKPSNLTTGNLYYVSSNYDSVAFRTEPRTNGTSQVISRLAKDTVVEMVEENVATANGYTWSKIKTEDGKIGYFVNYYLTPLEIFMDQNSTTSNENNNTNNDSTGYKFENGNLYIEPNTTLNVINKKYTVKSAQKNGNNIGNTANLPTGTKVTTNSGTYTVIKIGDANGDGIINSADLLKIQKHLLKVATIENTPNGSAADVNRDGKINSADLLKIQKYLLKVSDITI